MWCRSRAPSACPRVWEGCQGGCLLGLQQCPPSCWAQARQRLVWTSPRPRGFSHHPLPAFAWEPGELRAVSGSWGASSLTGRCVPCLSPCRWMQACAPGTAPGIGSWPPWPRRPRACPLSSAAGPVPSLRQAGHQKSLPPHVLTECPQQPRPAEPVSCSQGPKDQLAPAPIPEQNQRGQEGTREAGAGGETGRKRRVKSSGEAAAQQVRPLPQAGVPVSLPPPLPRAHPPRAPTAPPRSAGAGSEGEGAGPCTQGPGSGADQDGVWVPGNPGLS